MNWYDKFIVPIWKEYRIWGFAIVLVLILITLVVASMVLGVDVGGTVNRWLEGL